MRALTVCMYGQAHGFNTLHNTCICSTTIVHHRIYMYKLVRTSRYTHNAVMYHHVCYYAPLTPSLPMLYVHPTPPPPPPPPPNLPTHTCSAGSHCWSCAICWSLLGCPTCCPGAVAGGEAAGPLSVSPGAPPVALLPVG